MKKYKELLYKKHDAFDQADDENQKHLLKAEIKGIIEVVDEPDAQDYHILGLIYYDTSRDEHDLNVAHEYFMEALTKDGEYHIARLYSAHCYHDKKEYDEALACYLLVDRDHIESEYALWRHVKLLEQIGFCFHKLGKFDRAREIS